MFFHKLRQWCLATRTCTLMCALHYGPSRCNLCNPWQWNIFWQQTLLQQVHLFHKAAKLISNSQIHYCSSNSVLFKYVLYTCSTHMFHPSYFFLHKILLPLFPLSLLFSFTSNKYKKRPKQTTNPMLHKLIFCIPQSTPPNAPFLVVDGPLFPQIQTHKSTLNQDP